MSDASELIAQQMAASGVNPGELTPVGSVTKTYVDQQDVLLQSGINSVAGLAGSAQQTADSATQAAGQAQTTATAATQRAEQAFTEAHSAFGISETALAQAQKNAAPSFSQVNDIVAPDVNTKFYIVGGVGITVTTNPTTKEVTITATGDATPGPHAPSHLPGGSDPIQTATTSRYGLAQYLDSITSTSTVLAAVPKSVKDALDAAKAFTTTSLTFSSWVFPTLLNSFTAYSESFYSARYRKELGRVYIEGIIKSPTPNAGTVIFVLPAGFRPGKTTSMPTLTSTPYPSFTLSTVPIDIQTDGSVVLGRNAGTEWLSLAIPSFYAEG